MLRATLLLLVFAVAAAAQVRVLVVLRSQPQSQVMERLEAAAGLRLRIAESEYRRVLPLGGEPVRRARQALDEIELEVRRSAAAETARLVGPEQQGVIALLRDLGATDIRAITAVNLVVATIPETARPAIAADPRVAEIVEDGGGGAALNVSVPSLGAPALWDSGITGSGEAVAILDTGVREDHPFFATIAFTSQVFLASGRNFACFIDDPSTPLDNVGHGTHVAGIVASHGGPTGFFGVARGVDTIYNLKVLFRCSDPNFPAGRYLDSDVVTALDWLVANTAVKIVNFSAGTTSPADDSTLARLLDSLADTYGLFISVAAGNSGPAPSSVWSPAIAYNVVAVGNIDDRQTTDRADDQVSQTSSRGPTVASRQKPDIVAPGAVIQSANYRWDLPEASLTAARSGTSMAAPHIAGAAALLGQMGVLDPLAQKAVLINSGSGLSWQPDWGWGYANLARVSQQSVFSGALHAGETALYRGTSSGALAASLAWRRHVAGTRGTLGAMSLSLYTLEDGSLLSAESQSNQSVVATIAETAADTVVAVTGVLEGEKYGLAISVPGFVQVGGPLLSLTCAPPEAVPPASAVKIACTVVNGGDVEAFRVTAAVMPEGSRQTLGTIAPGASAGLEWSLTAPPAGTTRAYRVDMVSPSYGQVYTAGTGFDLTSRAGSSQP